MEKVVEEIMGKSIQQEQVRAELIEETVRSYMEGLRVTMAEQLGMDDPNICIPNVKVTLPKEQPQQAKVSPTLVTSDIDFPMKEKKRSMLILDKMQKTFPLNQNMNNPKSSRLPKTITIGSEIQEVERSTHRPKTPNFKKAHKTHIKLDKENQVMVETLNERKTAKGSNQSHQRLNKDYDPIKDKSLVQYFYPKQKSIIQLGQQEESLRLSQSKSNKKTVRNCKSEKRYNFARHYLPKEKCYMTSSQCGRNANFTDYDLLSCQLSLSQQLQKQNIKQIKNSTERYAHNRGQKDQNGVLKSRIFNLESRVMKRLPYLVRMGVSLKKKQRGLN